MRKVETHGTICLDGAEGLVYRLCAVSYTVWENGDYEYHFRPDYRVIDLVGPPDFEGIPGIDLSLRRAEYVRRNRIPVFISERTPAENREDLWKLLDDVGLDHLNQLEWLIRTETRYIGDRLYVVRANEEKNRALQVEGAAGRGDVLQVDSAIDAASNVETALRVILGALASGSDVEVAGAPLADEARPPLHATLLPLLEKGHAYRESMRKRAVEERGAGRRRKELDGIKLADALDRYERHEITAKDAASELGIGEATFYRRLKEHRSN